MTLPRSNDPLPANTIRFSEAFEFFYQSTEPRWQEIDARIVATSDRLNEAPPEPVELTADGRLPFLGTGTLTHRHRLAIAKAEAIGTQKAAYAAAWVRWYGHLANGDFDPRVRDRTGEALCLERAGWKSPGWGPRGGVVEDFVSPDDPWQPGPSDAQIDGYLRPLFFFRDVFKRQLKKVTRRVEQRRPGRKPQYDRARIREIVFEKMDHHGEFDPTDAEWRHQADLERAVSAELDDAPAESTI